MKKDKKEKKAIKNKIILRLGEILQDSDGILTLVKLNLLFILTSLPFIPPVFLFTFGPSAAAITYCTNILVKKGYLPDVTKTYISVFRNSFKKALVPGIFTVLATVIFSVGLYIYLSIASSNIIYIPLASVSLLVLVVLTGIGIHMFPEIAVEENKLTAKEYFRTGFANMAGKLPGTMLAVIISGIMVAAMVLLLPATLPLLLTIAFSVPALAMAFSHTVPEFPQ